MSMVHLNLAPASISAFEKDPQPLELQRLISACNNIHIIFRLYKTLIGRQVTPNLGVYKNLLTACLDLRQTDKAKDLWRDMVKYSIVPDHWCYSLLIQVYSRTGDSATAYTLFLKLKNKEYKFSVNSVDCSNLVQAVTANGKMEESMDVLAWMDDNGIKADPQVYVCLMKQCNDVEVGKYIHNHMLNKTKTEWNILLETTMIAMYTRCKSMVNAREVFDMLKTKNVVSWNTMILGYQQCGDPKESLTLFKTMKATSVHVDDITYTYFWSVCAEVGELAYGREIAEILAETSFKWTIDMKNSLLNMYVKISTMEEARTFFDTITPKNILTWNTLIAGYVHNKNSNKALELFKQMQQEGMQPNDASFTIALSACADVAALAFGKEIHTQIDKSGIQWTNEMRSSLSNMYAKCGVKPRA